MAGFQTASTLTKVALLVMAVGLLLFIIGFSTDYWYSQAHRYHAGLWISGYYVSFWKAVQAMECIGLILGIIAFILLILYLFISNFQSDKKIVLYSLISAIVSGFFILIGIVIWGTQFASVQLGWSFALACVGGVFLILSGLLLLPEKNPSMLR